MIVTNSSKLGFLPFNNNDANMLVSALISMAYSKYLKVLWKEIISGRKIVLHSIQ